MKRQQSEQAQTDNDPDFECYYDRLQHKKQKIEQAQSLGAAELSTVKVRAVINRAASTINSEHHGYLRATLTSKMSLQNTYVPGSNSITKRVKFEKPATKVYNINQFDKL